MAFTIGQLAAIENAIASGVKSVSYEGKTSTFGSLDDLLRVRNIIMRALGLNNDDNSYVVTHDRGYGDLFGGWDNQGDLYTGY